MGTQGFLYSRCVTIPGLPAIIHILDQLGISSPFSSCLRPASSSGREKRQQFQSNSHKHSMPKRKPDPIKASKRRNQHEKSLKKNKSTPKNNRLRRKRTKKKIACGETDHQKKMRQAAPCLPYVVKKTGFKAKRCASAHLFTPCLESTVLYSDSMYPPGVRESRPGNRVLRKSYQ